jgi:Arc/MetJ family transcription regulator
MRTNIEIDDEVMARAMQVTGLKTKRETVDKALRLLNQMEVQRQFRDLRGKINWVGDLDEMRRD